METKYLCEEILLTVAHASQDKAHWDINGGGKHIVYFGDGSKYISNQIDEDTSYHDCRHISLCNPMNMKQLAEAYIKLYEAMTSISKNGCCETCQEAKLVALTALKE